MTTIAVKNKLLKNLKGDIFGGITAGVIALPLALAFGVASGLGAAAGLYGAIIVGMFASIFGGTKSQVSGPTGPMTVVLASIVALHPNNPSLIFLTIVLAGLFQIIFGLIKVGTLIKYVPYPVISGFMSGIGTIIIILQLNPILGLPLSGNVINSLIETLHGLNNLNLQAIIIGLLTLGIVFFTPKKIAKNFPPALLALLIVTIVSIVFGANVETIGDIPATLPHFAIKPVSWNLVWSILPVAITLAILGSVDSLLTSLVADSITKTKHKPNKELIGQGIGNMFAGLFGGIAGAGATMRTVVNIKAGGRTRLSGVVHSLFLLTLLLGAAPLAKHIPLAVLAGILIKVGVDIVDYKFIKLIKNAPKSDLFVMIWVYAVTVFYDLIFAVGTGIVLSAILFAISVARQFNLSINDICTDKSGECNNDDSKYELRIIDINGVLFFGSASMMLSGVDDLLGTKCVILNCRYILNMDISAVFALEDIICRLKDKGIRVFLVLNNKKTATRLKNLGVISQLGEHNLFLDKEAAIAKAEKELNENN